MTDAEFARLEALFRRIAREELARAGQSGRTSPAEWADHEHPASESTDHIDAATDGTSTSSNLSMLEAEGRRFIASLQRKLKQKPGSQAPVRRRTAAR